MYMIKLVYSQIVKYGLEKWVNDKQNKNKNYLKVYNLSKIFLSEIDSSFPVI